MTNRARSCQMSLLGTTWYRIPKGGGKVVKSGNVLGLRCSLGPPHVGCIALHRQGVWGCNAKVQDSKGLRSCVASVACVAWGLLALQKGWGATCNATLRHDSKSAKWRYGGRARRDHSVASSKNCVQKGRSTLS